MDKIEDEKFILRGPQVPMEVLTGVGEGIFQKMGEFNDATALVDAETDMGITFSSLRKSAILVALALRDRGVAAGDIVSLVEVSTQESFAIALGVFFNGCIINALDGGWTAETVVPHQFADLKPKVAFCHFAVEDLVHKTVKENNLNIDVIVYDGPTKYGYTTYNDLIEKYSKNNGVETFRPIKIHNISQEAAAILCTSGTTGTPKGVMISHVAFHHLISPLRGADMRSLTLFSNSGMSWGTGIFMLMASMYGGATRVFTKEPFSERNIIRIIEMHKPNFMLLSCYQISLLNVHFASNPKSEKVLSNVNMMFAVGSRLSPGQVQAMSRRLTSGRLVISYGLTECMAGTSTAACAEYRPGTVGHVALNTELKIVDIQTGRALGPDQPGEIYLRGVTMLGYYGNPEETRMVLDPQTGWLRTGDIGHYDKEGYVYVTDRIKEIAKYRGCYINPCDIEMVLSGHESVRSCAVVTVPHDESCDLVVAYVELAPGKTATAEEIENFANEKLKDYERIRGGVYIVDKIPVLTHGKIAKAAVKKMAANMTDKIFAKSELKSRI